MIKTAADWSEISKFASLWNMDGLILIGFCEADYKKLRENMRISFVVYDGYFTETSRIVNLVINHYDGGIQAGRYLKKLGYKQALCISDNYSCMDKERMDGFCHAFEPGDVQILLIPKCREERHLFYKEHWKEILKYHAVFAVSDYYALDFIHYAERQAIRVPEDISVIGFDDNSASRENLPALTTIHQDAKLRAETAIRALEDLRDGKEVESKITLPVNLIVRESTRKMGEG